MAKIDRVTTDHYRIPLERELTDSTHGAMHDFELVTVRIADGEGAEGVGYTFTVHHGGAGVAALLERDLAPRLLDRDADTVERLWQEMWWTLHYGGRGGHAVLAISAIDIALWDLKARQTGLPLWRYFGAYQSRVPVYAGGIDLELPTQALLEQADELVAAGFRAIKMKVGRPRLREDVARVAAMRAHLGDDFPLMADANMKWSADEAIQAARALAEYELVWIEEPTIPDDVAGHARIVRDGRHAVAAGENLHTLYEFAHLITAGGVTYPEPDVSNCGGYTVFRKVCALAEAHNLPVTSHGVHDLTVHALAAAPNGSYLEAHGFGLDRYLAHPLEIRDGFAVAPERPGHGVELDWDALEAVRA
jgi:L-alanine-DL-glutamate epimerase-like enolase superfamily enzyme